MAMKTSADEIIKSIGNTRIVKLVNMASDDSADIYAKCEFENPSGSHKDRIYWYILDQLEQNGNIHPGMTLVDCSSGNGGAALSLIGTAKGYKIVIIMPEGMTEERKIQIRSYGGDIIETPAKEFLDGAVNKARQYVSELPEERYYLDQANTPLNFEAWRLCGQEIDKQIKQLGINIDAFICSIGTGGTFSGIAYELRKTFPTMLTVAIEVDKSAPLFAKRQGQPFVHRPHNLIGLGAGVLAPNTMEELIDCVELVDGNNGWLIMKEIIEKEKLMVGPTCGANLYIARRYAEKLGKGKSILTLFFDSSWKYYSHWNGIYPEYQNINVIDK